MRYPCSGLMVLSYFSFSRSSDTSSRGEPIVKDRSAWRNSTAENLNIGFLRLLDTDYVGVIAADTVLPGNYFLECVGALEASPELTSVSGLMFTERSTFFNSLYSSYETLLERRGLHHGIRGSGR